MGKLYSIISALLLSVSSAIAAVSAGYEWWFDNDVSTLQSGNVSGERFDLPIDVSALPKGTHYFNCRLNDNDGKWGSVYRKMFYNVDNTVGAAAYEYWFDNDYTAKKEGDISTDRMSFEVDASTMLPGAHYFNCRLFTNQGGWGSIYRRMVFTTGTRVDATAYEYWIDNNYESRVAGAISSGANIYDINLQGLRKGLHRFNYRIRTGAGTWGSVFSQYFYYSSKSRFTNYEYWLDNDYANRTTGTTSSDQVSFEIDLSGFDKSGEAHYFNMRVRDDDGDWSSFYRKLIIFYNEEKKAPLIGYRHSVNGNDLGYVKVERQFTGSYTFDVDLPEDLGFSVKDKELKFDGDKVSVGGNDSIHYCVQIESELGWGPPQTWDFEVSHDFSTTAISMAVNSSHTFDNPGAGEFAAVKFVVADKPLYVRADKAIALDIYRNGSKVKEITAAEVAAIAMLELEAGEYYGILHSAEESDSGHFTFHLMDTRNTVPTPTIDFTNGMVTITCSREDAGIYYTLDGSAPAPDEEGTTLYTEPFALDRNATVKAIAVVAGSDIEPSPISELVVNSYKVTDPVISFDNLMVVITSDEHEGVHTYYTLDGSEPTENSEEYGAPFSLTGNARVLARSFKAGYNPSNVVEYNHSHSVYVTGAPEISVNGTTVTLTPTTEGSTLYYSIDDPTPSQEYTSPFDMTVNGVVYAQARKSGMYDSEVVSYEVNSNKVGKPSIKFEDLRVVITSDTREGVVTYYTTDGSDPTDGSEQYTGPFTLEGDARVMARSYLDGLSPSDVAEYIHTHADYVTGAPEISVSGTTVTLTPTTEGSTLYYSIDDPNPSQEYTSPFDMTVNGMVYARARKSGMYDSEVVSYEVNSNKVGKPSIKFEDLRVVITSDTREGVVTYYTTDGSEPTDGSDRYTSPFTLEGDARVMARSYLDGLSPSDVAEYIHTHADYVTGAPEISVNGTTVTLTPTTEGSTLYYSIDDPNPSQEYTSPFDMTVNGVVYARARKSGMYDSEVVSYEVNSNKVGKPSIKFEDLRVVITSDTREGVVTYYTTDGSDPTDGSEQYIGPFTLEGDARVMARSYLDGLSPSDVAEYIHTHADYVTGAPEISVSGTTVTLTPTTEGSTLYYSIDDPTPSQEYTSPFDMTVNGMVYARARKSGMYDSEVVSVEVVSIKTDAPYGSFDADTRLLTLYCDTQGAVISYSDNNGEDWTVYEEPILIEGNRIIHARAQAPNHLESDIVEIVVSEFKCADVSISYDGRYVTLATSETDAEIRYTLDGTNPTLGEVYGGKFDAKDLRVVKAVAVKDGYMNSDFAEYTIEVYADENHAKTARGGILEAGYGWAEKEVFENAETYRIEGYMNSDDYSLIHSMKSLRHLDIAKVTTEFIPDDAFADMSLVTISMPENMNGYGESIFINNPDLCAVIWNSSDVSAETSLVAGVNNPNLLLYVNNSAVNNSGIKNAVENGKAHSIILTDGYPFHAPLEFEAEGISYTRHFSKETAIGGCAGWETLILPFDVDEIRNAEGEIYPFASSTETLRHFWLYAPIGTGWGKRDVISANEPYLIAMPNNPQYLEEYNMAGDVTFSADNAVVAVTPEMTGFGYKNGAMMWGNYFNLESGDDLWVVNDEPYDGNAPGSLFVKGVRDVRPFECYITSDSSRRSMPIFDSSEIEMLLSRFGTKIWCENHEICIFSGIGQRVNIYDTVGQLVRVADVNADEICRIHDVAPGVYIVGSTKILVK